MVGGQKTLTVPAGWVWKGDLEVWRVTASYQEVGLHKKVEGWLQMPGHCWGFHGAELGAWESVKQGSEVLSFLFRD